MADEMKREQPGREAEEQPEEGIPVKFNKQVRRLTTAEAAVYAQKGLKLDSLEPALSKLRYVAAASGRSLERLAADIYEDSEEALRSRMRQKAGGDEEMAALLTEAERRRWQKAYDAVQTAEREAQTRADREEEERRAAGFRSLRRMFRQAGGARGRYPSAGRAAAASAAGGAPGGPGAAPTAGGGRGIGGVPGGQAGKRLRRDRRNAAGRVELKITTKGEKENGDQYTGICGKADG